MTLTYADVWKALDGGPWPWHETAQLPLTNVVVDSRLAVEGSLFVALPGERTDGHLFVGDAFRRGARAALVHGPVDECSGHQLPVAGLGPGEGQLPTVGREPPTGAGVCFLVPDALSALHKLAAYWRSLHPDCRVVGVTGSVGKTTAKELIAAVLRKRFCTLKSPGNYNNEIGLPLTMLELHAGVEWVVQEMGMYGLGEIGHLAAIARPEVGVVTNVGPTHLERLGSIERIARAKAELVQALPEDGLAVLNGDDARVRAMGAMTTARRVFYYGVGCDNDLWASDVQTHGLGGLSLAFHLRGDTVAGQSEPEWRAQLPLLGRQGVYGALSAAAVGLSQGLTWGEIVSGLEDPAVETRVKVLQGLHGATILDDTYNANPASTVAALDLLAEMDGRKIAVLGGMLELGSFEEEGHRQVGQRAAAVASLLVTVGRLGQLIAEEAVAVGMPRSSVHAVADHDAAAALVRQVLENRDFVLVKGSRGIAMESIVAELARGE